MLFPFPEADLINLVKGKESITILERSETHVITEFVSAALMKAFTNQAQTIHRNIPALSQVPRLYTGTFGLGGRDYQPGHIIATFDNATNPNGQGLFYLGNKFFDETTTDPVLIADQAKLKEAYPHTKLMSLPVTENPDLYSPEALRTRFYSVGGYGTMAVAKMLADTLLQMNVYGDSSMAAPKYGSEKKGAPTFADVAVDTQSIRVNSALTKMEAIVCPDGQVFQHTNPLNGLVDGGTIIVQSTEKDLLAAWMNIPAKYRQEIRDRNIKLYIIDAFALAAKNAPTADLRMRMAGMPFIGAFFSAVDKASGKLDGTDQILDVIQSQIHEKWGKKGDQVKAKKTVDANFQLVKDGMDNVHQINYTESRFVEADKAAESFHKTHQVMATSATIPQRANDPVHFQSSVMHFFKEGKPGDIPAHPGIGSFIPAGTSETKKKGLFTQPSELPVYIQELCTGCIQCAAVCPDTAIPNAVHDVSELLITAIKMNPGLAQNPEALEKQIAFANELTALIEEAYLPTNNQGLPQDKKKTSDSREFFQIASEALSTMQFDDADIAVKEHFQSMIKVLEGYSVAMTGKFFHIRRNSKSSGLYAVTIDPQLCTGCGECITECPSDALKPNLDESRTAEHYQRAMNFFKLTPNTNPSYIGADLEKSTIPLSILLDRNNYYAVNGGHGACRGCGETTALNLFAATNRVLQDHQYKKHIAQLQELLPKAQAKLQNEIKNSIYIINVQEGSISKQGLQQYLPELVDHLNEFFKDPSTDPSLPTDYLIPKDNIMELVLEYKGRLTEQDSWEPFVKVVAELHQLAVLAKTVHQLEEQLWFYQDGPSGRGPAHMAAVVATGCQSVYASTFPFNPWKDAMVNSLFHDSLPTAVGIHAGLSLKTAEDFKAVRIANLILDGLYNPEEHLAFFRYFTHADFSPEEKLIAPSVVTFEGDGASNDIGYGAKSRFLMSDTNIKAVVLDTQAYSNTGGQASTATFKGQSADLDRFGKAQPGRSEQRKEIGNLGMFHNPKAFIGQLSVGKLNHHLQGNAKALRYNDGPALLNIYTTCQPEHGVSDNASTQQATRAVDSRAFPVFLHEPKENSALAERLSLKGNPDLNKDWATPKITITNNAGLQQEIKGQPFTFADFAVTEGRFKEQFSLLPEAISARQLKKEAAKILGTSPTNLAETLNLEMFFVDPHTESLIPKGSIDELTAAIQSSIANPQLQELLIKQIKKTIPLRRRLTHMSDYLNLSEAEQAQTTPFVWWVDSKGALNKVEASQTIVASTKERLANWRLLQELAGIENKDLEQHKAMSQDPDERSSKAKG